MGCHNYVRTNNLKSNKMVNDHGVFRFTVFFIFF